MLYATIYLLVAVLLSGLVLTSYVFADEKKPVFPTSEMLAKSALLALIWPALLVVRLFIRADRRWNLLKLMDIDREFNWDPAPNLLTVARRVLVNYYADKVEAEKKPAKRAE